MTFQHLIRLLTPEPVKLSIKGKWLAVTSCFFAVLLTAFITKLSLPDSQHPILVASMGASAVILFIIPNSPLAQPWAFVGGQMVSVLVGVFCAQTIADTAWAASVAAGGSIFLMLFLRCLHPPAAATALTPVMSGHALVSLGYSYALIPVGINVLVMLSMAIIVNRWLMNYDYPVFTQVINKKEKKLQSLTAVKQSIGVSELDLLQALEKNDVFLDITTAELSKVLATAELVNFKRLNGIMTCADIMVKNVIAVEYGTEVEDAWKIMLEHNLKAIPVIDRARRVIGMITRHDFFKFIELHPYQTLADRLHTFIRRTRDIETHKPEAVGHLMTTTVITCAGNSHIVELIPLMSQAGHKQIPIIDNEQRLIGMVYQVDLVKVLYQQVIAKNRI